jgi:hypothetical protein
MAPPAGPLSIRRTGKRRAVSTVHMLPDDIIINSGHVTPMRRKPSCMRTK